MASLKLLKVAVLNVHLDKHGMERVVQLLIDALVAMYSTLVLTDALLKVSVVDRIHIGMVLSVNVCPDIT